MTAGQRNYKASTKQYCMDAKDFNVQVPADLYAGLSVMVEFAQGGRNAGKA